MTDDKQSGYNFVHDIRFGKGQGFSDEARTGLSQGAIPAFHVIGLSASFANTFVSFFRKDELIGLPEIAVTVATCVGWRDLLPQFATGRLTPISDDKRQNLESATAHDCPQPAFVPFFMDK